MNFRFFTILRVSQVIFVSEYESTITVDVGMVDQDVGSRWETFHGLRPSVNIGD
jgi:hypothetical protein